MSEPKIKPLQIKAWDSHLLQKKALFLELLKGQNESFRLLHTEGDPLRMDKGGEVLVAGWWNREPPPNELAPFLDRTVKDLGARYWYVQWRPPKSVQASSSLHLESSDPAPDSWVFEESGLRYEGRKAQGDAFGLFLDQRENRKWIRQEAAGKDILNLFAFTCGFSLAAAMGGASTVTSVDLYQKYLDWGKVNFGLNGLEPDAFEFRKMDSQKYLKWLIGKGRQFDIVVCDPPSFSRNGKALFKLEKDYQELIESCLKVLRPKGTLLFSTNFEKWSSKVWSQKLKDIGISNFEVIPSQKDFEGPGAPAILKSYRISKEG